MIRQYSRLTLPLGAIIAIAVLVATAGAIAQDLKLIRIGTGSTGGTYFPVGGLIASAISNPPGSRDCDVGGSCGVPGLIAAAVSTQGSVQNVIDVAGGEKIPRKGGPGITKSDLLVINKIDLARYVGASLDVMRHDTERMRAGRTWVMTNLKTGEGLDQVIGFIEKEGLLTA